MRRDSGPFPPGATVARSMVLLIDPSPASRDITALLTRYYGYEVFAAATFEEGMHLAREMKPAGIITELITQPPSQRTIVDALADDPATSRIPVLVLSDLEHPDYREAAMRAGAAAFLPKPVNGQELRDALVEHVGDPPHAKFWTAA